MGRLKRFGKAALFVGAVGTSVGGGEKVNEERLKDPSVEISSLDTFLLSIDRAMVNDTAFPAVPALGVEELEKAINFIATQEGREYIVPMEKPLPPPLEEYHPPEPKKLSQQGRLGLQNIKMELAVRLRQIDPIKYAQLSPPSRAKGDEGPMHGM